MEFTRAFSGLSRRDADLAGGKGASLGEMLNAGIPVPDGFVVLAGTFEHFIKETDLVQEIDSILGGVDHKAIHTVDAASEKIRALILSKEMPEDIKTEILNSFAGMDTEFVAVRSSATAEDGAEHAWAGQLESYLNVTKDNVLEKVQHCWSSLFTPRAIFYRFEKGLHSTHISVAVVVQKMVNSEVSGIAFSVHPVTEDYNQMIIEAGFGLGEAIVSGSVTPDSYVIEKEPRNILDINVSSQTRALWRKAGGGNEWRDLSDAEGNKQVLDTKQILELGEIIMRIENHYGFPCDIEWAFEGGKFYIVQSRPITTLSENKGHQPELFELMHSDMPLAVAELNNDGETLKNLPWADEPFEIYPYCLHQFKDGFIYLWYDQKGIDWKMEKSGKVDPKVMEKESLDRFAKIKDALLNEKTLNREEFKEFVKNMRDAWPWLECMWWMVEYYAKEKLPMDDVVKVRKATEYFAPGTRAVIRNTFTKCLPGYEDYINFITIEEFLENKLPDKSILDKRKKEAVYGQGRWFDSLEEAAKYFNVKIKKTVIPNSKDLKGQTAYHGNVKGRVKRVESKQDMLDFKEGDIIVSSTTTPDFLPVMKIAGAIISQHGGAVCHAAITSRELKKPCVVGIVGVTKILKDGDLVEVDADNGIVRILK